MDLHSRLSLHLFDALLGGLVVVTTLRGERALDVPGGTQSGDVIRLEHAGIASSSGGLVTRGHHYFEVTVLVPDASQVGGGEEARALLQSLSKLLLGQGQ